jgi:hypothetical protein
MKTTLAMASLLAVLGAQPLASTPDAAANGDAGITRGVSKWSAPRGPSPAEPDPRLEGDRGGSSNLGLLMGTALKELGDAGVSRGKK